MHPDKQLSAARRSGFPWVFLFCLAAVLGGCGEKEPPLSKETLALKWELDGEMEKLTKALSEPVAREDWKAVQLILLRTHQEITQKGTFPSGRLVVIDVSGITQVAAPHQKQEHLDFSQFNLTRTVYTKKRKAQAVLYLGQEKYLVFMVPVLGKGQVIGAVAVGFPEAELHDRWKVTEKEFLQINFNRK